jgi:hypothetical protein
VLSFKLGASLPKFDEIVQNLSEVRPDITEKVPQNQRGAVDPANRLYPATAGKKRRFLKKQDDRILMKVSRNCQCDRGNLSAKGGAG